ncbi:MAG TPA: aspartate carbamoyltransferase [Bacteroidota bacterium]|nr:aspartate carbamoyltransferase [Bacteroidota bacterium]
MKPRHIIGTQQFTLPMLTELFERTREMERVLKKGGTRDFEKRVMGSLFFESGTLTRFSFETAMRRLGGGVVSTETASTFFSTTPEDSLEDTIRVVSKFCDVIALRHNSAGGARRAAAVSACPLVNAGDGKGGQHPTQALLDLYTIHKETNTLDGLRVAMVGNLADGRTVRSLSYLLGKYERVKIYFVAPDALQMKEDMLAHLSENRVWYTLEQDLRKVLPEVDVVYATRVEREKFPGTDEEYAHLMRDHYIDRDTLCLMHEKAIVMHPLSRSAEISPEVDSDPRAAYFRQTENGIVIRMALLAWIME